MSACALIAASRQQEFGCCCFGCCCCCCSICSLSNEVFLQLQPLDGMVNQPHLVLVPWERQGTTADETCCCMILHPLQALCNMQSCCIICSVNTTSHHVKALGISVAIWMLMALLSLLAASWPLHCIAIRPMQGIERELEGSIPCI